MRRAVAAAMVVPLLFLAGCGDPVFSPKRGPGAPGYSEVPAPSAPEVEIVPEPKGKPRPDAGNIDRIVPAEDGESFNIVGWALLNPKDPRGTLHLILPEGVDGTIREVQTLPRPDVSAATANIKNTGVRVTATERTTVKPQNDLTITKAGQPDPVCARSWPSDNPGDLCTGGLKYTFVVGNSGMETADGVVVRDALPAGVVYDSYQYAGTDSDFACTLETGNVLSCTKLTIARESTETFSIIVVPPSGTGPLTNNVIVDPENTIFEADETNNDASATVQVSTGIDLTVFKYDKKAAATADPAGRIPA